MTTDELSPCPFCGSFAQVIDHTASYYEGDVWAECTECGGSGPRETDRERAIRLWNRRPSAQRIKLEAELIEQARFWIGQVEPGGIERDLLFKRTTKNLKQMLDEIEINRGNGESLALSSENERLRSILKRLIASYVVPPLTAMINPDSLLRVTDLMLDEMVKAEDPIQWTPERKPGHGSGGGSPSEPE